MSALILVVDDEPDTETLIRQHFRHDLRSGRFELRFADCGPVALAISEAAGDRRIILLLSDINMSSMSGLDLLVQARAARADVPVIMDTAYGDADTERRALEAGAGGVLPKPIDFAALRAEVDTRLARSRAEP